MGLLRKYSILIIALLLSIAIHIVMFTFLNIDKPEQAEPSEAIEISVIPKEKVSPTPTHVEPIPLPDSEVTMDKDVFLSPKINDKEHITPNLTDSKEEIVTPIETNNDNAIEIVDEQIETIEKIDEIIDEKRLADASEIIERIARQKPPEKEGEESASYNAFEERYASYFTKFRSNVYKVWRYPQEAISRGQTGVVRVSFSILRDGRIVNIKMKGSSGYQALDREVLRVLKTMGTVPLPESYNLDQLNIDDAYFIYTMGGGVERYIQ